MVLNLGLLIRSPLVYRMLDGILFFKPVPAIDIIVRFLLTNQTVNVPVAHKNKGLKTPILYTITLLLSHPQSEFVKYSAL
jgi:hypothetical protein